MINIKKVERNLKNIYVIQFLLSFKTYMPILILFFRFHTLNYFKIFLLQSISSAITLIFEIPSGYFADKYGRKKSLLISSSCLTIATFMYFTLNKFEFFVIAEILFGIAFAFLSGTDDSIAYDSLKILGKEDEVSKYFSKIGFIVRTSFAISALIGGIVSYIYGYNFAFGIAFISFFCSIFFILNLEETTNLNEKKERFSESLKSQFKETFKKEISNYVFVFMVLSLVLSVLLWYMQPYLYRKNVSDYLIGLSYSIAIIISAFITKLTAKIEQKFGFFRIIITSIIIVSLINVSLIFFNMNIILIFVISIIFSIQGITGILFLKKFNENIENKNRATFNSILSFYSNLINIILLPIFGAIADGFTINLIFIILLMILLLLLLYFIVFCCRSKYRQNIND